MHEASFFSDKRKGFRFPTLYRMTTEEKFKTLDYIWSSISVSDDVKFPVWHERELKAMDIVRFHSP